MADNVIVGSKVVSGDSNGRWKYTFRDYPKYRNGKLIIYSIEEIVPEGYVANYSGYDIENTYSPEETNFKVRKNWDDRDDHLGLRPSAIKVQLYGNGNAIGEAIELSDGNGWSYTWTGLPKYEDGKLIEQ